MLSASSYLFGTLEVAIVAASAVLGGVAARRRLLPEFEGIAAWVAGAVVSLALPILVAEVLGTFGLLKEWPFVIAVAATGAGLHLRLRGAASGAPAGASGAPVAQRATPAAVTPRTTPAAEAASTEQTARAASPRVRLAGILLAAVCVAHFTIGVRLRLSTGMTGFDSTWYHGPFAAGFASGGHTFDLQLIAPQFLAWFYPQNSELLHGVGDLLYGRDLLSPLINLGWLIGCIGAAWAIGRPYGAGPVSAAGAALILDTGVLADQAGEARNDLAAAFFLLAAVAVLVNAVATREDRRPGGGALAVCALAAGLAAGTKVNLLPVAGALVLGLIWLAAPPGRSRAALIMIPAALLGGGYWYLRNLVHAGNPVPQVRSIGPVDLPAPGQTLGGREGHSVLSYLTDGSVWGDWFGPGLHGGLGLLWPALLVLGAGGLVGCLLQRSEPVVRVAALVGLVAAATWVAAPTSASGPDGMPLGFESGLRYLVPALLLGAALAPLSPALRDPRRRIGVLVAIALAFPFADRSAGDWGTGYLPVALVAGIAFAAVVWFVTWPGRPAISPRLALAGTALVAIAVVGGGYRVQRSYLESRYADPQFTTPGLDAAFRWAQPLSGERIATTTTRTYPLLGRDLSNEVQYVGEERPHGGFVAPAGCEAWIRALNEGSYDYVVASRDRLDGRTSFPPEAAWTAAQPSASVVLRRAPAVVFRLSGPLDPTRCAAAS